MARNSNLSSLLTSCPESVADQETSNSETDCDVQYAPEEFTQAGLLTTFSGGHTDSLEKCHKKEEKGKGY